MAGQSLVYAVCKAVLSLFVRCTHTLHLEVQSAAEVAPTSAGKSLVAEAPATEGGIE